MVQIKLEKVKPGMKQTQLLVLGLYEGEPELLFKRLENNLSSVIKEIVENGEFTGTLGSNYLLPTFGKIGPKRIMLIGLGKKEKYSKEYARIIAGKISLKVQELGLGEFSLVPFSVLDEDLAEAIFEGICLSTYKFSKYKSVPGKLPELNDVTILIDTDDPSIQAVFDKSNLIVDSVIFSRDLCNLPPNDCPPAELARVAMALANEYNLKVRVIERYEMESLGLNGIISVGKGSSNQSKLIIVEYHGASENQRPYLFVGKAVTFDTGGISLKPGEKMDEMKFDKCGGCSVLAVIRAAAALHLPLNIVAIVPSVENMPSGSSYRPGDIIRMYNGKTVEVANTDAEGRIILADSLAFGIRTYDPKAIIDVATLTGAAIIALGANVAAAISNNIPFMDKLKKASEKTGEKLWELPLYEEFHDQIKSNVADIKNLGGRQGGAITAAAFLANFVADKPWIHLDIAGTAWTQDGTYERSYIPKGATGYGVRTLVKLLQEDESTKN
jgi:leucyl aminopeptidase